MVFGVQRNFVCYVLSREEGKGKIMIDKRGWFFPVSVFSLAPLFHHVDKHVKRRSQASTTISK